jgi:plasmid stability protein
MTKDQARFLAWVAASHGQDVGDECRRLLQAKRGGGFVPLEIVTLAMDRVYAEDLQAAEAAAAVGFNDGD